MNLHSTSSVISSPVSAFGVMPFAKPDGPTTGKSGPEAAPANLSAWQAKEGGLLTSGTYGRRYITFYHITNLSCSLGSRLQAKTDLLGSTLFKLTWKQRLTPSGRLIFALRASALRTSGKGSTLSEHKGWPTPNTPS